MDKYENKIKFDELKQLIGEKRYENAADLCDSVNWKKIKNISALMNAGEAYTNVGRYEDAKEVLLNAYDRSPLGRMIVYRLCEIAIRTKNFEEAEEYYTEFVDIAPHDNLRYVLRYEILKAQGATLEEKIALLEEYKEEEYTEQWAFELAYLYHKAGESEKCIDACDELVLWFGDGPYVEKALELKMLYQPLNKIQEQKYRDFRSRGRGNFVEIHANDRIRGGEIPGDTVVIPDISVDTEKFNTVNLQKELAKSMEQIANATEAETVSDTMDMIKKMVEEIPYLALAPEEEEEQKAKEEEKKVLETAEKQINEEITANFQNYLAEEIDGQMSLNVPGGGPAPVRQITGQLSIDEILAEWEMTQRAAEAAIADANQKKLEVEKTKALQEADDIMKRLSEMIPDLDAGLSPKDILEKKYTENLEELSKKDEDAAARMVEDMTGILQQQIIRLQEEAASPEGGEKGPEEEIPDAMDAMNALAEEDKALKKWVPKRIEETKENEEAAVPQEKKIVPFVPPRIEVPKEEEIPESPVPDAAPVSVLLQEEKPEKKEEKLEKKEEKSRKMTDTGSMPDLSVTIDTAALPVIELPLEEEEKKEPEKAKGPEKPVERAPELSPEEKEIFSYFTAVEGVEEQVRKTLFHTEKKIMDTTLHGGHLMIQSAHGNGKTQLATDFVKVLQKRAGRKMGHVGRIEALALNQKDIPELLKKVKGGVLIIENAGQITRETAVKLSLQLQSDTSGLLLILEDTRDGLEKAMSRDASFAEKFTERIIIPTFSMDELVEFAKAYAREQFYEIDEMAVLALYDRITRIERLDAATTLAEVKEIVDDAIAKAERISFRNLFASKKAEDNSDYTLLREKDFE